MSPLLTVAQVAEVAAAATAAATTASSNSSGSRSKAVGGVTAPLAAALAAPRFGPAFAAAAPAAVVAAVAELVLSANSNSMSDERDVAGGVVSGGQRSSEERMLSLLVSSRLVDVASMLCHAAPQQQIEAGSNAVVAACVHFVSALLPAPHTQARADSAGANTADSGRETAFAVAQARAETVCTVLAATEAPAVVGAVAKATATALSSLLSTISGGNGDGNISASVVAAAAPLIEVAAAIVGSGDSSASAAAAIGAVKTAMFSLLPHIARAVLALAAASATAVTEAEASADSDAEAAAETDAVAAASLAASARTVYAAAPACARAGTVAAATDALLAAVSAAEAAAKAAAKAKKAASRAMTDGSSAGTKSGSAAVGRGPATAAARAVAATASLPFLFGLSNDSAVFTDPLADAGTIATLKHCQFVARGVVFSETLSALTTVFPLASSAAAAAAAAESGSSGKTGAVSADAEGVAVVALEQDLLALLIGILAVATDRARGALEPLAVLASASAWAALLVAAAPLSAHYSSGGNGGNAGKAIAKVDAATLTAAAAAARQRTRKSLNRFVITALQARLDAPRTADAVSLLLRARDLPLPAVPRGSTAGGGVAAVYSGAAAAAVTKELAKALTKTLGGSVEAFAAAVTLEQDPGQVRCI